MYFPTAGEDYLETSTALTNSNLSSYGDNGDVKFKCIAIRIVDDFVPEDKESFNISLTTTSHVVTLYSSSTVVVFDDDDEGTKYCHCILIVFFFMHHRVCYHFDSSGVLNNNLLVSISH